MGECRYYVVAILIGFSALALKTVKEGANVLDLQQRTTEKLKSARNHDTMSENAFESGFCFSLSLNIRAPIHYIAPNGVYQPSYLANKPRLLDARHGLHGQPKPHPADL